MKVGPFKKGVGIEGALLMDMAPTLLHLMGQKIPESMDGRALVNAFDPAFVQQHPVHHAIATVRRLSFGKAAAQILLC